MLDITQTILSFCTAARNKSVVFMPKPVSYTHLPWRLSASRRATNASRRLPAGLETGDTCRLNHFRWQCHTPKPSSPAVYVNVLAVVPSSIRHPFTVPELSLSPDSHWAPQMLQSCSGCKDTPLYGIMPVSYTHLDVYKRQ